ncbi:MAG: HAD family hydrolase [Candidatus Omnitrophica bacterium]|nr:HAD family hydrolase [Candidatus Omnitrophota bacterium]
MKPRRAVFLDRDGVLLKATVEGGVFRTARSIEEFELLPRVAEALGLLRGAGLELVVVTNQPEVKRGFIDRSLVEAFHDRLRRELGLAHIYTCYHDDGDHCACRKPEPGMLRQAARELGLSLKDSFLVGDRWRDIEAGRRAGCRTLLVRHSHSGEAQPDWEVESLYEAARKIITLIPDRPPSSV